MNRAKKAAAFAACALSVGALGLGPAMADAAGPTVAFFKSPLPVVGGTLSNSSATPSFQIKDGWNINDADGICSASTDLYTGSWSNVWNFTGSRSVQHVNDKRTWTTQVGRYDELDTYATDCLGNTSEGYDYIYSSLRQEGAASFGPAWASASCACFSGGSVFHSAKVGAKASYSFSGRLVSLVSNHAANRGKVSVSVDGKPATTVTLTGSTLNRAVVWNSPYLSKGTHLVNMTVVSGRVDIDGFLVQ